MKAPKSRLSFCLRLISTFITLIAIGLFVVNLHLLSPESCVYSLERSRIDFPSSPSKYSNSISRKLDDPCIREYERLKGNETPGLTLEDLERSRALVGNRQRLSNLAKSLTDGKEPVNIIVCGGSISLGHGVHPNNLRYSDQLEVWLNNYYPLQEKKMHRVWNRGSHGADMCAMAKRINIMTIPPDPDLFILEFAVNDYQGQDHKIHLDHKTDVFFDGFQELALCAEVVVHKLLTDYPNAAVVFMEFQTAILNRKTANVIHMGVAQHYQIPVISYADTMFPAYYQLVEKLQDYDYSSPIGDPVQPFPHGCAPCRAENIVEQFRKFGCKSVCVFMMRSGYNVNDCKEPPPGREECFPPFFAHDAIHLSGIGHQIARDLIIEAILSTSRDICQGRQFSEHLLPKLGWMASPDALQIRSDFILVKDTMEMFSKKDPLKPTSHTAGFSLYGDGMGDRKGWIATNENGGESIEFEIDLPPNNCYAVYVAALKSYENMGVFTINVTDIATQKVTEVQVDGIWEPHISIPSDIQVTMDDQNGCSGKCKVTITTHPQIKGRRGNKVKIMTLSARKCTKK